MEDQIRVIYQDRVELKSGGYLIINPTEAMITIDVNSGRGSHKRNVEETAYQTNTEAAEEIARQLRLRDLGGLIVIDFIDMMDSKHNAEVEKAFKKALEHRPGADPALPHLQVRHPGALAPEEAVNDPGDQLHDLPLLPGSGVRPSSSTRP